MPTDTDTITASSITEQVGLLELALIDKGEVIPVGRPTHSGIELRPDMTLEEWTKGLRIFRWAQTNLKLSFAAYLAYGELKYGKIATEDALVQLEFDMPNVTQALHINSVPKEMRYENLTADHYIVLARAEISAKQRYKWAQVASERLLTPAQLKTSIAYGEVVSTSIAKNQTHGIVSVHGLRADFDIWLRRVGGAEGILAKQDAANIHEIIGEIEPMAELSRQLKEAVAQANEV